MVRHALGLRITAESAKKAPDLHWESWSISRIPAEPAKRLGVLQVGHPADMQWNRSRAYSRASKEARILFPFTWLQ